MGRLTHASTESFHRQPRNRAAGFRVGGPARFGRRGTVKSQVPHGNPQGYPVDGTILTTTYLLVGVLLPAATLSIGTRTLASGK